MSGFKWVDYVLTQLQNKGMPMFMLGKWYKQ